MLCISTLRKVVDNLADRQAQNRMRGASLPLKPSKTKHGVTKFLKNLTVLRSTVYVDKFKPVRFQRLVKGVAVLKSVATQLFSTTCLRDLQKTKHTFRSIGSKTACAWLPGRSSRIPYTFHSSRDSSRNAKSVWRGSRV